MRDQPNHPTVEPPPGLGGGIGRPPRPTRRRLVMRGLLLVAGLALGVVAAEGAGRVLRPSGDADLLFHASDASPEGLYCYDPELIMRPTPGFQGEMRCLGHRVPIRINSLGLRGPEAGAAGKARRWITVGDSMTISIQVREEDTFQSRLSRSLGSQFYNAGVDGYSTWQSMIRYKRLAPRLESSGVLLVFFLGNDLQENQRFKQEVRRFRDVVPGVPVLGAPLSPWTRFLLANSYLYGHYRVWQQRRTLTGGTHPAHQRWRAELLTFTSKGSRQLKSMAASTAAALAQLKQETQQRGHRLLVAVAPPAFQVEPRRVGPTFSMVGIDPTTADVDAPLRAVLALLRQLKIQACDLAPSLRRAVKEGRRPYFNFDGHWTAQGHQVVSQALAACLASGNP